MAAKAKKADAAARKPRTDSAAFQVRQLVVRHPEISFEAICKKLGLKGADAGPASHAHNMWAHAKAVMAIAVSAGWRPR